jgi:hypothetical protein
MSDPDLHRLAVAVESLSGKMDTGIAAVRGDINLVAQAQSRTHDDVDKLDLRVKDLEGRRFPLAVTSGTMGVAAVAVSVYAAFGKG